MSHIYVIFLKCLEFSQMCFETPGLGSIHMHTHVPTHALCAYTEAEQAYKTKILLLGTLLVHKHQRLNASYQKTAVNPVQGYCIKVQWPLKVTWALALSTGQSFHRDFQTLYKVGYILVH